MSSLIRRFEKKNLQRYSPIPIIRYFRQINVYILIIHKIYNYNKNVPVLGFIYFDVKKKKNDHPFSQRRREKITIPKGTSSRRKSLEITGSIHQESAVNI